jgi:hypothetical protein
MKNQFDIKRFNQLCAEFLGYINTTPTEPDFSIYENRNGFVIDERQYTLLETMSMKFHSDWNWIMQVVDKIEGLKEGEEVEHNWYVTIGEGNYCRIFTDEFKTFQDEIIVDNANSKKEAVVLAIWEFLQWYNQNKV